MKKLWGFVNFVGLLIAAAGFITHSAVLIVLGIAVCLLGEWQKSRVSEAQRAQAQTGAIRPTLADVFDSADYQPDERLSGLDIDPMQLLLHQDYHYVDGCDKITATYHGVSVLLGNVRLMDTDVFRDEESGMERKTEKEVWQGLMLTCKVGHSFPIGFAIAPRGKIDGCCAMPTSKQETKPSTSASQSKPTTAMPRYSRSRPACRRKSLPPQASALGRCSSPSARTAEFLPPCAPPEETSSCRKRQAQRAPARV